MPSQNAITNFKTKAQTFRNDNYMSNDMRNLDNIIENEVCNAFMHLEKSVLPQSQANRSPNENIFL